MALDGEKLRNIRTSKGMSQEKLALMANVNKRTIQRAEKGDPIALETAAFIAEAVGVTPAMLRGNQLELFEPDYKAQNEVVLVPVNSGRRMIDVIRNSFEAEIHFDVEPTNRNIELLAQLASILELFQPSYWETPMERYDPSQSEVLQKQAEINELVPSLLEMNINMFLGTYSTKNQIPNYDMDEGCMYVRDNYPYQSTQTALVIVSDTSATHLIRKPDDISLELGLDEEIPF